MPTIGRTGYREHMNQKTQGISTLPFLRSMTVYVSERIPRTVLLNIDNVDMAV